HETDARGASKRAQKQSGWLDGQVIAAGDVRQGKVPTLVSMLTGFALVELLRPRRSRSLPRHFVFGVTRDRVVAFATLSTGDDGPDLYELWIRPGEVGSWPRSSVRLTHRAQGAASTAATLELEGVERLPVYRASNDPSTAELFDVLAG